MSDAKRELLAKLNQPTVRKLLDDISPDGLGADYFVGTIQTAFQAAPNLLACPPASLIRCLYLAAQLGLPIGEHGVYLVPRAPKKGETRVATPVIDYRALIELAMQHPKVDAVHAAVVREGDVFRNNVGDLGNPISHEITLAGRGDMIGAWCIVVQSGQRIANVMTKGEILACRPRFFDSTPWAVKAHEPEMWRKTVLRRGLKTIPQSPKLRQALHAEDAIEAGDFTAGIGLDMPAELEAAPGGAPPTRETSAPATSSAPTARDPEPDPEPASMSHDDQEREAAVAELQDRGEDRRRAAGHRAPRQASVTGAPPARRSAPAAAAERAAPSSGNVHAELGVLMAEMDNAAVGDPEINDRFRMSLQEHFGGALAGVKTMEDLALLRRDVFPG